MSSSPTQRTRRPGGLGRGLSTLIGERPPESTPPPAPYAPAPATGRDMRVPIEHVQVAPWQPRRNFRPEAIEELASSIRERGILQPLWVRPSKDGWELIAGERRLRAARSVGVTEVPVHVLEVDDREALELALVENLQREDLDPIEEAEGYRSLADRFGLTQEQIASRVGRARASVANALRLLDLPESVKAWLAEGRLSTGHAKALLGVPGEADRVRFAKRMVKEGWSVRDAERAVARFLRPAQTRRPVREDVPESHIRYLADRLRERLGTGVSVHSPRTLANGRKQSGSIRIEYYGSEDLDRLLEILGLSEDV